MADRNAAYMTLHVRTYPGFRFLAYAAAWVLIRVDTSEHAFQIAEHIIAMGTRFRIGNERKWRSVL